MNKLIGFVSFLVVLFIIFFLLGIINLELLALDECHLISGVDCKAKISITAVEFIVKNNLNRALEDFEVYVDACGRSEQADNGGLMKWEEEKITVPCYNEAGDRFKSKLKVRYKIKLIDMQREEHSEDGLVAGRVLE